MALFPQGQSRARAKDFVLADVDRAFIDEPYPLYAALRRHNPVCRQPDGSYFVSRYRDLVTIYQNPEKFSSDKRVDFKPKFGDSSLFEHHTLSLVFNDPPYHTRVRALLTPFFSPHAMRSLTPRVETLVDGLLDQAEDLRDFDLIRDFAIAIPLNLIGDMLGVPAEERAPMREWAILILGALEPTLSTAQLEAGCRAVDEFKAYLRDLIVRKKRTRSIRDDADILGALLDAQGHEQALSELELLHNCIFLLNAGHDTTTSLIANGLDALFRFPDQWQLLKEQPSLIDTAVEEILRLESPLQIGNRKLTEDYELGGAVLPAGTFLHLGVAAANHDEEIFDDPERLNISRFPNKHLAFAKGIHTCAGNTIGRMEGAVALGKLVARFSHIERRGSMERGARARFRTVVNFPVGVRS